MQRIGFLYLEEQLMKFSTSQCERHLQLAECQNGTRFDAMCSPASGVSQKQL
jgi:hypothetical protein